MKAISTKIVMIFIAVLSLYSCKNEQSLQGYFVDSMEKSNFMSFDISTSMLNIKEIDLTEKQQKALKSLRKLNILVYKKNDSNAADFKVEKAKIDKILSQGKFAELMKVKTPYGKGSLRYYGEEDAIDEVVVYGSNDDKGFLVMRVLGDNINPADLMQVVQALEKSDYKGEGLGEITEMFK